MGEASQCPQSVQHVPGLTSMAMRASRWHCGLTRGLNSAWGAVLGQAVLGVEKLS